MLDLPWRKSTYSGDSSNCIETAAVPLVSSAGSADFRERAAGRAC
ncbi:DUF397 domain-containing protein [Streptomyces anandii]